MIKTTNKSGIAKPIKYPTAVDTKALILMTKSTFSLFKLNKKFIKGFCSLPPFFKIVEVVYQSNNWRIKNVKVRI